MTKKIRVLVIEENHSVYNTLCVITMHATQVYILLLLLYRCIIYIGTYVYIQCVPVRGRKDCRLNCKREKRRCIK